MGILYSGFLDSMTFRSLEPRPHLQAVYDLASALPGSLIPSGPPRVGSCLW